MDSTLGREATGGGIALTAAILAGGKGSRLGGLSKESIRVDGEALGPRLVRILSPYFKNVIVITNNPELYEGSGAIAAADSIPGFGPLSGLHAALSIARRHGWGGSEGRDGGLGRGDGQRKDSHIWLAACDMPAFDPRLVALLAQLLGEATKRARNEGRPPPLACLARHGDHFEPFQAIYSTRLIGALEGLFGETDPDAIGVARNQADRRIGSPSFKELFARAPASFAAEDEVRKVTPDWGLYFNVNTPEELARLADQAPI